jgi:hypothetical protein
MTSCASRCTAEQETQYRVLTEAEALQFCEAEELAWVAEEIRVAYRQGYVCVGALKGGHLAAWVWLNFSCMPPPLTGHALGPGLDPVIAKSLDRSEAHS